MKKNSFVKSAFIILIAALLMLAGCTTSGTVGDLMTDITGTDWPDPPAQVDAQFQAPMMNFAWKMFQSSMANDGNVLISPASIYLALAMTMNGAQGDTLTAMQTALQSQDLSLQDIDVACRDWISLLRKQTDKTRVSVANSIWYRQEYAVAGDFLQANADYFDAEAQALDFTKAEALGTINGWVKDQTQGAIEKIIDQINGDTMMYLINAVYFKSDWLTPFDANDTTEGVFNGPGEATVQYMHRSGNMSYVLNDGVTGVMLPYEDGRYSFFALMPAEDTDVRDYITGLDGEGITALLTSMQTGDAALTLPKFETRYEDSLVDELTDLGMGIAFDAGQADFSGMSAGGSRDLYIGEVLHKTFCRVDEKGTEAAAVTSVEMRLTAILEPDTRLTFDRPFVYGIVDLASGTPLFLGVMENPES